MGYLFAQQCCATEHCYLHHPYGYLSLYIATDIAIYSVIEQWDYSSKVGLYLRTLVISLSTIVLNGRDRQGLYGFPPLNSNV